MSTMFDLVTLLAMNEPFAIALLNREPWAVQHAKDIESLARGEGPEHRRRFDGTPHKWCGITCPFSEGCVTCTLPENPTVATEIKAILNHNDPVKLATHGIIKLCGEVDVGMFVDTQTKVSKIRRLGIKHLTLEIDSEGGSAFIMRYLCDLIMESDFDETTGIVTGFALSAAALILQTCEKRVAHSDAFL